MLQTCSNSHSSRYLYSKNVVPSPTRKPRAHDEHFMLPKFIPTFSHKISSNSSGDKCCKAAVYKGIRNTYEKFLPLVRNSFDAQTLIIKPKNYYS